MGSVGISRLVGAWHGSEQESRRLQTCKLLKLWAGRGRWSGWTVEREIISCRESGLSSGLGD